MEIVDHFLDGFFRPKTVAVVGATNNPYKTNFRLVHNLDTLNFEGGIYPVNPTAEEILGVKTFSRLQDIPDSIDLVITAVPASRTMDIVRECGEIGVKKLVIVAGGFSEGGERGQELHREISAFIKDKGIRTLGPNTLTPINTSNNLVISYNPVKKLKRGNLSFAFQSGFYEPKMNWIFSHLGINKMLDMGNKMDINEVDALEYFSRDPETKVIAMHIESIKGNAKDFYEILREVSRAKPVIILKSGRTQAGSKAAASHTGSIARENDLIFDGMIKQTAAIRAGNIEEFFDLAKAFQFLELPQGNRVAIIVLSGGEGVMAVDACEMNGLKLASISDKTNQKVKEVLPPWEIPLNPFDAGVCMQFHFSDYLAFFDVLSAIPEDGNVNCAIMQMPLNMVEFIPSNSDIPEETVRALEDQYVQTLVNMKKIGKPFALWRSSMDIQEQKLGEMIESHGLPVFQSSERAAKALSAMHHYRSRCSIV